MGRSVQATPNPLRLWPRRRTERNRPRSFSCSPTIWSYSDPELLRWKLRAHAQSLDRLAQEGVRFYPLLRTQRPDLPVALARGLHLRACFPARWNFTTYLDTRAKNLDCEQTDFLPPSAPALARVLKAAGYATGHFGKWHLGGGRDVLNAPPFSAYGYDEHSGTYESPEPDPNLTATPWIWSPLTAGQTLDRTPYFVDHTLDFLRRHQDQPCYAGNLAR